MSDPRHERRVRRESPYVRAATGSIILTAGVVFWLDHLGRLDARDVLSWWPVALIVIGLSHLLARQWVAAAFWLVFGTFFLLPELGYDISPWRIIALWPLLISVAGVTLILQALRSGPRGTGFHATAVMAGNNLRLGSREIAGGDAVAVMGGCNIDLSSVQAAGGEIVIDVLAFWGGIEIRVPAGWNVVGQVAQIFGGFEDKTAPGDPTAPRLVVRGSAIMGGVEVKTAVRR